MMTSKERVREAVCHRETDRLPIAIMARQEVMANLAEHFGTSDHEAVLQLLNVDLRGAGPEIKVSASPYHYADPTQRVETVDGEDIYCDIWGVGFARRSVQGGEYLDLCASPLRDLGAMDDLTRYPFPTADLWDYSSIPAQLDQRRDYFIGIHTRGFFEISWFMRGMDNFMTDLFTAPEYAETLMDRIIAYLTERTVRVLEQDRKGLIDFVEINDDVGGQNGLLLSPELWRTFIKPRMRQMVKRFKEHGVFVRYHCCGGLRDIIPDLLEIGIDILNPVQPLARGMELRALKKDFGATLTFDGGIDTQELLPNKRGAQFEEEVRETLRFMGKGGGFIVSPSHAFQVDVPLENILKLYELAALPYASVAIRD